MKKETTFKMSKANLKNGDVILVRDYGLGRAALDSAQLMQKKILEFYGKRVVVIVAPRRELSLFGKSEAKRILRRIVEAENG